jgi:hypothetical protein
VWETVSFPTVTTFFWKKGQTTQWAKEKGQKEQTTIYKTLHRKQKIEQHEPGDKS